MTRRVIVSGALANKPLNGGNAWTRLNWLLGFRRLGFEIYFIEEISGNSCVDATGAPAAPRDSINAEYFRETMEQFDLQERASLICDDETTVYGKGLPDLKQLAAQTDLLLNISGHLQADSLKSAPRCKIFLDDDPGYTQFWHASGKLGSRLTGHDHYFTLGENIGRPECCIPTDGIPWQRIRVPVVLEEWPMVMQDRFAGFTTVGGWRGAFGVVEFNGKTYGQKVHEFRKFIELPRLTELPLEIALSIHPADFKDREALQEHGWRIVDPSAAATPDGFRSYIQKSTAEFSVAQGIYVQTRSGWFSDRTAAYLASGKPALIQDTGFSRNLPTGKGLIAFSTLDEACEGAAEIAGHYKQHYQAARKLAEQYFDSDKVLGKLLSEIGL
jgi:hypothetical protein